MTLTAKDVADITRLLEESSFDELYLELDGVKLSLRRGGTGSAPSQGWTGSRGAGQGASAAAGASGSPSGMGSSSGAASGAASGAVAGSPSSAPPRTSSAGGAPAVGDAATQDAGVHEVSAPLLGTFYRAPKPGAPPFVEIGTSVEEETIIGIIEVMKLMNTVRAGVRGRVTEILARDGALVEYGEPLLRVGPS